MPRLSAGVMVCCAASATARVSSGSLSRAGKRFFSISWRLFRYSDRLLNNVMPAAGANAYCTHKAVC
ncbi:hypothetical protein D3C76_1516230 [compost metagenome]